MRSDANRIAFGAAKQILASARPLNLDVAGTHVTCTVTQRAAPAWPTDELADLDASRDGPWPSPVEVECRWDDGTATLRVSVERWNRGSYRGLVGLRVRLLPAIGACSGRRYRRSSEMLKTARSCPFQAGARSSSVAGQGPRYFSEHSRRSSLRQGSPCCRHPESSCSGWSYPRARSCHRPRLPFTISCSWHC